MKTILVTGGAGFIGSHLCDALLKQNKTHQIICLDNFSTGRKKNIQHLFKHKNFELWERDVCEQVYVPQGTDVYHLASPADPEAYLKDPIGTLRVNAEGTRNLLETVRQSGGKFLLASTSEVYGDPKLHPQPESYNGNVNPVGIRSCYDEGKRYAEAITMAYKRTYGLQTHIARIFNTYGKRLDDKRAIPTFFYKARNGGPVVIYGNGQQTRSFCHVSDTVRGLMKLMDSTESDPINIGNDQEEISMESLAKKILKLTKSKHQIVYQPRREDDPQTRKPDLTKARKLLNWSPYISLAVGLKDFTN